MSQQMTRANSSRWPRQWGSHKKASQKLGIDPKTLRRHFRKELNDGLFQVGVEIGGVLNTLATKAKDEGVQLRPCGWTGSSSRCS
jgi:hypothetical protein